VPAGEPAAAPPIVHNVLTSPGQPLDQPTRGFFEQRFQYDFSRVRVHTDAEAARSAAAVGARAYTVGPQIVFGPGSRDRRLLGHELTHVVQQGALPSHVSRIPILTDPASEREADQAASRIERGQAAGQVNARSRGSLQREPASAPEKEEELGFVEDTLIDVALAPALVVGGTAGEMLVASFKGFYIVMKTEGPSHAAQAWERVKEAFHHPSEILSMVGRYWWGLIKGIFSPITGLISLGKLIVSLPFLEAKLLATAWKRRVQLAGDLRQLYARGQVLGSLAGETLSLVLDNPYESVKMLGSWFLSLGGKAVSAANDAGRSVAKMLLAEATKPLPELGEDMGEFIGTVLVNVALFFFTAGIGDAIAQLGAKIGELGAWLGEAGEAGEAFGSAAAKIETLLITVGGWITKAEEGLAAATETIFKPIAKLMKGFGDLLGDLRLFFRDLFEASEEGVGAETKALGNAADKATTSGAPSAPPAAVPHDPPTVHAPAAKPAPEAQAPHAASTPAKPAATPHANAGKDADVIDLAAEREKRAIAAKAKADAAAKVRKQKIAVGDGRTRAAYTDEEIADEHAAVTTHRGQGDQINKRDPADVRKTPNVRTYEYDPWTGDSTLLGKRLGPPPGPGYQAHHMVPGGEPRAAELRDFMRSRGWKDINDADNGVWLPTHNTQGNLGGEFKHEFTFDNDHFNDEYFTRLEEILMKDPKIGASGLRLKLRNIRAYLRRGQLPPASL
jgi:hypothetical protein